MISEDQAQDVLRKHDQLAQLLESARHLTQSLEVQEVLRRICADARGILKAYGATIYRLEPDGKTLTPQVSLDPPFEAEIMATLLHVDHSLTGEAIRAGRALTFNDALDDPRGYQIPGTTEPPDERVIAAPFVADGETLGAICLNRFGDDFTPDDQALAETFATYAAAALKNARIHEALARENEKHRQTAQSLRESEATLRTLFGNTLTPILVTDSSQRFVDANAAGLALLECSLDELRGKAAWEFAPPEQWDQVRRNLISRPTRDVFEAELLVHGRAKTLMLSVVPVTVGDRQLFYGVGVDITERRALEQRLREAHKLEAVGKLAGGVAHEYNNLLTVINGYTQLLLGREGSDPAPRRDLEEIATAGERAATLTRQLLAFARKQVLRVGPVDLNALLAQLQPRLAALLTQGTELSIQASAALPSVLADAAQLAEAIKTLVLNAHEAIAQKPTPTGHICIETTTVKLDAGAAEHVDTAPGDYVVLAVRDDGVGMTQEIRERMFEPFYTTKPVGQGTGLDLPAAYGVVRQLGGHIHVDGAPGVGTMVRICLPAALKQGQTRGERYATAERDATRRILLVEDDAAVRALAARAIRRLAYEVSEARDASEALRIARESATRFDLLVTDVMMPGMNGHDLALELRRDHPDLAVVFISGYSADILGDQGLLLPGAQLMEKPFDLRDLARVLERAASEQAQ